MRLRHLLALWVGISVAITVAGPIFFAILEKAKVEVPSPN